MGAQVVWKKRVVRPETCHVGALPAPNEDVADGRRHSLRKMMPHFFSFGSEVAFVKFMHRGHNGHLIHDF